MSDSRDEHGSGPTIHSRRSVLKAGAALAVAPLVGGVATRADAAAKPAPNGPFTARAYGNTSATGRLEAMQIKRRAVGPNDVLLDVLFCGICHSDIHQARNEWTSLPTVYPCVPGHEIVGRVQAVGSAVTKFKVGDVGGVGCMVDSCGNCENCLADREQNCLKGAAFTYNSPDHATGENTLGGYSEKMVVSERFVIRIPPGADLAATAPLLCAGITTFSPMQHWRLSSRQRVGVIGLGGLGHMAVKLAAARKAKVTGSCRLLRGARHQGRYRTDPPRADQPNIRPGGRQGCALPVRHRPDRWKEGVNMWKLLVVLGTASVVASPSTGATDVDEMKIRLKVGATSLTATLLDSRASRDFAPLLPLTLTMNDLFGREKYGHLPRPISEEGRRELVK